MTSRYYFLVGPNSPESVAPPTLFIYETENDDTKGTYTAHHKDKDRQETWERWLKNRYFPPSKFVTRFGYSAVAAGKIRDEAHLRELFEKCEIPYPETSI